MTVKLNLLGAQRIKALTDILNMKMREEIKEAERVRITEAQINEAVDTDFGINVLRGQSNEAIATAQAILNQIEEITGVRTTLQVSTRIMDSGTEWARQRTELRKAQEAVYEQIRANYREKESRLWLVETLEEAKELVGIE